MTEKITKLQRWLDLIAFLIGRRYPVSVDQIMEAVPAYAEGRGDDPTAVESVRRMFERDKKELRDLGIPIETLEYTVRGAEQTSGYLLARRDFYLPYLRLIGGGADAPAAKPGAGGAPRADVFDIDIPMSGPAFDTLSRIARDATA